MIKQSEKLKPRQWYRFWIGDFNKETVGFSHAEKGVFIDLINAYNTHRHAPTEDEAIRWACARTEDEKAAVRFVLDYRFRLSDGRYFHDATEESLREYAELCKTNKDNRRGGGKKKATKKSATKREPVVDDSCDFDDGFGDFVDESSPVVDEWSPNQEPINQEPINQDKGRPSQERNGGLGVGEYPHARPVDDPFDFDNDSCDFVDESSASVNEQVQRPSTSADEYRKAKGGDY